MVSHSLIFLLAAISGMSDEQVYQRGDRDQAQVQLTGTAPAGARAVEARVLRQYYIPPGLDWTRLAEPRSGQWEGSLAIPAGGPYRVEFRWLDGAGKTIEVASRHGILVGDLWILAGQSNMQGVGNLVDVEPPNGQVNMFDMSDQWRLAEEPLHSLADAVDSFHWRGKPRLTGVEAAEAARRRVKGAGLGLPFATTMVRYTGVPVGLVPCAHGGTSMEQWSPSLRDQGGASLYGAMVRRHQAVGGRVKGVLWYQGEAEANATRVAAYAERMKTLVQSIRTDFRQPDLPFYYVQIGRVIRVGDPGPWNAVQDIQRRLETEIPHAGMVAGIDLALDDLIHVGTPGLKVLGLRLAQLATGRALRGPRIVSARVEGADRRRIRVSFRDVNGRLISHGRPAGFSLQVPPDARDPQHFNTLLEGDSVLLLVQNEVPGGAMLWYGRGLDPYANIVDEKNMALPVTGPLPIE
jgi:sialate O-acetylesterase